MCLVYFEFRFLTVRKLVSPPFCLLLTNGLGNVKGGTRVTSAIYLYDATIEASSLFAVFQPYVKAVTSATVRSRPGSRLMYKYRVYINYLYIFTRQ